MQDHINIASKYKFHGGNALLLEQFAAANYLPVPQWLTKAQAAKQGLTPRPGAVACQVILNEKAFSVYNIADMLGGETAEQVAYEKNLDAHLHEQQERWLAPEEEFMTAGHPDLQPSFKF